ncbi:MAG: DUF420 domain-containing protein [Deltaproteobacteria bacterium]|jgi:putative membrane protein|nr:DUF420 domain-containing protein [Deltaproteobacteria bacterium]MBT6433205.1 DUF420 domain-containing protein [Deltaproteobacteria bacterium]MBT6491848.1 DUF420 domain-containing protein [Deltaproteobacteria bacterium]
MHEVNRMSAQQDSFWLKIIYVISAVLAAAVAFLILGPRPEGTAGILDVSVLPTVNASLNALTGTLLVIGLVLVKTRRIKAHKQVMLASFGTSSLFLVSYVIYHWFKAAPKSYVGDFTTFYYFILLTHIVLAALILPLALVTLYRGWNNQVQKHRNIAKITFPIWMYVSITGVVIYVMLYL